MAEENGNDDIVAVQVNIQNPKLMSSLYVLVLAR